VKKILGSVRAESGNKAGGDRDLGAECLRAALAGEDSTHADAGLLILAHACGDLHFLAFANRERG
jgi:hypothetical protein